MVDRLTIPDWLRIPQAERDALWKANPPRAARRRRKEARTDWRRPKTWTPEAAAIERELGERRKAKDKARFALLRERHGRR
jgi:hypothetical protein